MEKRNKNLKENLNSNPKNEINTIKRKQMLKNIFVLFVFIFLILAAIYISDSDFRRYINLNIFKNEIREESLNQIQLRGDRQSEIITAKNNIYVLSSGVLTRYDKLGQEKESETLGIGQVIYKNEKEKVIIGEKDGRKLYFINDGKIVWNMELDINISALNINSSGYVLVVGKSVLYPTESIAILINDRGEIQFKKYSTTNLIVDADISDNNKYIAILMANYSGVSVNSEIEFISVQKAINEPENSIETKYSKSDIAINLDFKSNDSLLVQYANSIMLYNLNESNEVFKLDDTIFFADINISSGFFVVQKIKSNVFSSDYEVKVLNMYGNEIGMYVLGNDLPKSVASNNDNIVLNMGQDLKVLRSNGWLKKKYISNRDIYNLEFSDDIIAIIYKDKIDILEI